MIYKVICHALFALVSFTTLKAQAGATKVHIQEILRKGENHAKPDRSGLSWHDLVALNTATGPYIGRYIDHSDNLLEQKTFSYLFNDLNQDGIFIEVSGLPDFKSPNSRFTFDESNVSQDGALPYEKLGIAQVDLNGTAEFAEGAFVKKVVYQVDFPSSFDFLDRMMSAIKIQKKCIMKGKIIKTFTPVSKDSWPIALVRWVAKDDQAFSEYKAEYLKDLKISESAI